MNKMNNGHLLKVTGNRRLAYFMMISKMHWKPELEYITM